MSKEIRHGWTYVTVSGEPRAMGKMYGESIKEDMKRVKEVLEFMIPQEYGVEWSFFVRGAAKYFSPVVRDEFPEYYEEMEGFAEGSGWPIEEVVAWNNYYTLIEGWWTHLPAEEHEEVYGKGAAAAGLSKEGGCGAMMCPAVGGRRPKGQAERCSAFIATGEWTQDGQIVMAHSNFSNFLDGQLAKYVVDMRPARGHRILMLGYPGWIWSGTDFFVTGAGIMGTETTIGGFTAYAAHLPISCRIRSAMQYGNTLDDYQSLLVDGNSGDYANSWLFGDCATGEIMRVELGLKYHAVERTKSGCFIGFNAAYDPRIRNLECVDSGFDDVRRHQGARRVRLADLMDEHKGRLTTEIAKDVLADHFDVYLEKENPCSRTCCAHYELDGREYMSDPSRPKPFQPRGAVDGNVCDTAMARAMSFELRWGNSCGTPFDAKAFCDKHRQWKYMLPFLDDRPAQPWTVFASAASSSPASSSPSSSSPSSSSSSSSPASVPAAAASASASASAPAATADAPSASSASAPAATADAPSASSQTMTFTPSSSEDSVNDIAGRAADLMKALKKGGGGGGGGSEGIPFLPRIDVFHHHTSRRRHKKRRHGKRGTYRHHH